MFKLLDDSGIDSSPLWKRTPYCYLTIHGRGAKKLSIYYVFNLHGNLITLLNVTAVGVFAYNLHNAQYSQAM